MEAFAQKLSRARQALRGVGLSNESKPKRGQHNPVEIEKLALAYKVRARATTQEAAGYLRRQAVSLINMALAVDELAGEVERGTFAVHEEQVRSLAGRLQQVQEVLDSWWR